MMSLGGGRVGTKRARYFHPLPQPKSEFVEKRYKYFFSNCFPSILRKLFSLLIDRTLLVLYYIHTPFTCPKNIYNVRLFT